MTIAILATGDEIIYGDTLNTNGHAIAQSLSSEGLTVGHHMACTDQEQDMVDCLQFLCQNHNIIILIGGLGPTSDDRTRFAVARFLSIPLIEFPAALNHIQARLMSANLKLNAGNRQQALFPPGATLVPNLNGTAMGCYYNQDNKLFILLPGPPSECLSMFNAYIVPLLQQTQPSEKQLLKWRLFGVAEGAIADKLDGALAGVDCETGYRLETPYLEFKVRCIDARVDEVKQIIEPLIAPHIIASPMLKASERLRLRIEELQQPIVILDDVTGGILQTLLQKPSNYRWLTFHENEQSTFHFHLKGLEAFWLQQSEHGGTTPAIINYHYDGYHGSETHQLPFFSPFVVHYAAEWLSFRLFHLINQLHQSIA